MALTEVRLFTNEQSEKTLVYYIPKNVSSQ